MNDGISIKPLRPAKVSPNPSLPAAAPAPQPPAAPPDASVASVKPELESAHEADQAARELLQNLAGAGQKSLDALGQLDQEKLKRLLSDD